MLLKGIVVRRIFAMLSAAARVNHIHTILGRSHSVVTQ